MVDIKMYILDKETTEHNTYDIMKYLKFHDCMW